MSPELVIFDCDGVLVDSEIVVHRVGSRKMTELGFPLTVEKSIEIFSGVAEKDLARIIHKEYGRTISEEELKQVVGKIIGAFPGELESIKGIDQVLDHLDEKQMKRCIASNSFYDDIIRSIDFTGLGDYFDRDKIYSVCMVEEGKPKPDLFLHAAEKFQVEPEDCLVIEDSVVGIEAAKAAKIPVIGFLGATHTKSGWYSDRISKAKPDAIAEDSSELLNLLKG